MLHTHGQIDEGIPSKTELMDRSTAVSSAILETPGDDQCWLNLTVCIHQLYRNFKFQNF
jgi:hypothetical protein